MIEQRGIEIKNDTLIANKITSNKIIMEYANEYGRIQKWKSDFIADINHIEIYKKCYLLYELVRMFGQQITDYYKKIRKESQVK